MMKMIKHVLFLLIAIIQILKANDTELGSYGYNLVSMTNSKVQMLKEIVYVKIDNFEYKVHCKFWFYNHGENIKLKVGFPDFDLLNGYNIDNEDLDYHPIKNFKSLVNDKPVNLEYSTIKHIDTAFAGNQSVFDTINNNWYIKYVEFPEHDSVIIENYYEGELGGTVAHSFSSLVSFNYIIGTGSSWYGNILDGLVVFDYTDLRSSDFIRNAHDLLNINNIKVNISENITTFEFKDYKPPEEQTLGLEFYNSFFLDSLDYQNLNDILSDSIVYSYDTTNYLNEIKNNFDAKKIDRMSKELLARNGYIFNNNKDISYFKQKSWYKPKNYYENKEDFDYVIKESKNILFLKKYCSKKNQISKIKNINEHNILKIINLFKIN
jgi:hypothetical protein